MITDPAIERFLDSLAPRPDAVLEAMEKRGRETDFPIVGPVVGNLLEVLARSIGAKRVFEMGSGFGYSTAWFARAVGDEGEVVHTDGSQELSGEARTWLERTGLAGRVRFEVGDALALLEEEKAPWDIVFIDIDKPMYPEAWESACDRVRKGGMVVTDNTLWQGRVAVPDLHDDATRGVREYLRRAYTDDRFLTTLMPLRDGVAISLRL